MNPSSNPDHTVNQSQLNNDFWQALHEERFQDAGALLAAGAEINQVDHRGQTPFLLYAGENRKAIVEWLYNNNADINARDRQGRTALHRLIDVGITAHDVRVVGDFLALRPDLDVVDNQGISPLHYASLTPGGEPFVHLLLDKGANPNSQSNYKATALLAAASNGYRGTVLALLENKADPSIVDHDGKTFYHALVSSFSSDLLRDVLAMELPLDINRPSRSGSTALSSAIDMGDVPSAVELLKHGANPNARSTNRFGSGATALQLMILAQPVEGARNLLAANQGRGQPVSRNAEDQVDAAAQENLVELAIDSGADPWAVDADGRNAWHYLGLRQVFSENLFNVIAQTGLSMEDPTGPGGRNPLRAVFDQRMSAFERQKAIAHMLAAGFPADPPFVELSAEYRDNNPEEAAHKVLSPLAAAVVTRARYEIRQLLDAGADPSRLDDSGLSPLHRAMTVDLSQTELMGIQALAASGRVQSTEKHLDAMKQKMHEARLWTLSALVGAGGDLMVEDGSKARKTPFLLAVAGNQTDLVQFCLENGADPLQRTSVGDYAVLEALNAGRLELFHALVAHVREQGRGAELASILSDAVLSSPEAWQERTRFLEVLRTLEEADWVNYRDADGNTPLILAAATSQQDVADILLARGAEPDMVNNAGESAMMHAIEQNKGDIIRALRQFGASTKGVGPDGVSIEDQARDTHHPYIIRSVLDSLDPRSDIMDFVKPGGDTFAAMERVPALLAQWKQPLVFGEEPVAAEPPKEKEEANGPKKKNIFGF